MKQSNVYKWLLSASLLFSVWFATSYASVDSLKVEIEQLQKEINQYQDEIKTTQSEAQTLSSAIRELDTSVKKLNVDIKLTQKKIELARLTIKKLEREIGEKGSDINSNKQAVGELLRSLRANNDNSIIEVMVGSQTFAQFWSDIQSQEQLNEQLLEEIYELKDLKRGLEDRKSLVEREKRNLLALSNRLDDQKKILNQSKLEKQKLLTSTRERESNYSRILREKLARQKAVEEEIRRVEEGLPPVDVDYPAARRGMLDWPLDVVRITQYFGDTSFARNNPQVYNGRGHSGVDFGAPVGTPIKAPLNGTVAGAGDTDPTCPGASYGKWILLDHGNGLSTVYAHLSLIKVAPGQTVAVGEVIGYTGNTGYSTGPHLHMSLVATAGIQIGTYQSKVRGCGVYTMPLASINSYLNPLAYI